MQTFLPYPNFAHSARVLDNKRLGKQRAEVKQIGRALRGETRGWVNHPAVVMWRGYEYALMLYGEAVAKEWTRRGYIDATRDEFLARAEEIKKVAHESNALELLDMPWWFGMPALHASHASNLVRKEPGWYGTVWPNIGNDLPYAWPSKLERRVVRFPVNLDLIRITCLQGVHVSFLWGSDRSPTSCPMCSPNVLEEQKHERIIGYPFAVNRASFV